MCYNGVVTENVTAPPLAEYRVVGLRENWYQAAPDAPKQPGGSCWHCGTGIAIEVVIKSRQTGESHVIGTTCAERVGLDGPELKKMLAERFAEQREQRRSANAKARVKARADAEAEAAGRLGPHGSESRFLSGCFCEPCVKAAPHGTVARFRQDCACLVCIDTVVTGSPDEYEVIERDVIVDLDTGEVVDARKVDTRYGYRWCVKDGEVWLPVSPARRSTHANKGYVEASAPFLCERRGSKSRGWWEQLHRLGDPIFDNWQEPIVRSS